MWRKAKRGGRLLGHQKAGKVFLPFGGWEQPGHHCCVKKQKVAPRLSVFCLHRLCDQY